MGGGNAGDFGSTKGSAVDAISDLLTAVSLIPGIDTFADLAAIPVDLLRGDFVSAGIDVLGIVPVIGEVADTTKLARMADKAADAAKVAGRTSKGKKISNAILKSNRVGKATKTDAHHAFPNIIDNYAGKAQTFSLKGADGKRRTLYQIKGSLNGKNGIFEWILDNERGVTHRRFIPNGKITGRPNSRLREILLMYEINFEEYTNLLSWSSIYWGIKKGIIEPESAILYTDKIVERNPNIANPEIIELLIADTQGQDTILSLIKKIIANEKMLKNEEKTSLRKLRYVLLLDVKRKAKNKQELLEKAEDIYADFDYPSDMESFISYMPVRSDDYDASIHTDEENEERLISEFDIFMDSERAWLEQVE
ncbi:MAG: DUF2247 family protein [Clostridia bacterium]|nr:DUF2247 family protein [Clostridia bacterium]